MANNQPVVEQEDLLKKYYDRNMRSLKQQQSIEKQRAEAEYQKLLKYLPQQLAKQGMGTSGMAGSYYLEAQKDFQNTTANINSAYQQQQQELQNVYDTSLLDKQAEEQATWGRYVSGGIDDLIMQYTQDDGIVDEEEMAKVREYLDQYRDRIGAQDYEMNLATLADYQKRLAEHTAQQEATQAERMQLSREFGVSMNDEGLDAKTLTPAAFSYKGSDKVGSKQYNHALNIINAAEKRLLPNGFVVDMNFGAGKDYYVFYNGKFYKTTKKPTKFASTWADRLDSYNEDGTKKEAPQYPRPTLNTNPAI